MLIDAITGRSRLYLVKLGYFFDGLKDCFNHELQTFLLRIDLNTLWILPVQRFPCCERLKVQQVRHGLNLILNSKRQRHRLEDGVPHMFISLRKRICAP